MADEKIVIEIKDGVDSSISTKIKTIATNAKTAHTSVEKLKDALKVLGSSNPVSKLNGELKRLETSILSNSVAQNKLQDAENKAALSKQKLSTEIQKTQSAMAQTEAVLNRAVSAEGRALISRQKLNTEIQRTQAALATTEAALSRAVAGETKASIAAQQLAAATVRITTEQNNAANAAQRLATEQARTSAQSANAAAASDRAAMAALRLETAQKKAATASTRASSELANYTRSAAAFVGIGLSATAILQSADAYTTLQNKLRNVAESQGQVNYLTKELFRVANTARTAIQETTQTFQRFDLALRQLGKSQQDSLRLTETVTKALTMSGATTGETAAALLQLSQAFNKGKLDGDEFRTVMELMPSAAAAIAKQLKVTRGELLALAPEGKITAQVMFDAFTALGDQIDKRFAKTIPTLAQSMQVLRNRFTEVFGEINAATGITEGLARAVIFLAEHMDILAGIVAGLSTTIILSFIPALAAIAGPAGLAAGAIITLTSAIVNLQNISKRAFEQSVVNNITGGAEVIQFAMYDLLQQFNALNEEFNKLGGGRSANAKKNQLQEEMNEITSLLERYALALKKINDDEAGPMGPPERLKSSLKFATVELDAHVEARTEYLKALEDSKTAELNNIFSIKQIEAALISERLALTMTAREQKLFALEMELLSKGALPEVIDQLKAEAGANYDLAKSLEDAAAKTERLKQSSIRAAQEMAKAAQEKARQTAEILQKRFEETRDFFAETFVSFYQNGKNAFDSLASAFEAMIVRMMAQWAASGLMKVFNISGGTNLASVPDSQASILVKGIVNKFAPNAMSNTGFGDVKGAFESYNEAGTKVFNSELFIKGLKTIGLNIGAGIAGDIAGTKLGETIFNKEANSKIGSQIGGAIGAAVGGPLGSFIGSSLGSLVDVAAGGDGKLRRNAGMFVGYTPSAEGSDRVFNVERFKSGLDVQGFARREDKGTALQVIETFRTVDTAFTALVKELKGSLDVRSLNGLDEQATPGSSGTFLGLGGNGTLAGDLKAQLNDYVKQLANNVTGLSEELINSVKAAASAEDALSILSAAVISMEVESKATAQSLKDAEVALKVIKDSEERFVKFRYESVKSMTKDLENSISLQKEIRMEIYKAMGAIPLFGSAVEAQIEGIKFLKESIITQHEEQLKAELELHETRIKYAKEFTDYAMSVRLGQFSNLSPTGKFELAQSSFRSLSEKAKGGDKDSIERLQDAAQSYIELADASFASSKPRKDAVSEVLAVMDELSISMAKSEFNPVAANKALVNELEKLDVKLADISKGINQGIINELKGIVYALEDLSPQIRDSLIDSISEWIKLATPNGEAMLTALGGIKGSLDLLPPEIAAYMTGAMGAMMEAMYASGRSPSQIANAIPKGSVLDAAANASLAEKGLGSTQDYRTSDAAIRAFVEGARATAASELDAIKTVYEAARSAGIGSQQLAGAMGYSQADVLAAAAAAGLPSFSGGGIATGPDTGYLALLHGTERVEPIDFGSNSDAANEDVVAILNEIKVANENMVRSVQVAAIDAARQREEQKAVNESVRTEITKLNQRRANGSIG